MTFTRPDPMTGQASSQDYQAAQWFYLAVHLTRSRRRIRTSSPHDCNRHSVRPHAVRLLQAATPAGSRNTATAASAQCFAAARPTSSAFALGRPRFVHLALCERGNPRIGRCCDAGTSKSRSKIGSISACAPVPRLDEFSRPHATLGSLCVLLIECIRAATVRFTRRMCHEFPRSDDVRH